MPKTTYKSWSSVARMVEPELRLVGGPVRSEPNWRWRKTSLQVSSHGPVYGPVWTRPLSRAWLDRRWDRLLLLNNSFLLLFHVCTLSGLSPWVLVASYIASIQDNVNLLLWKDGVWSDIPFTRGWIGLTQRKKVTFEVRWWWRYLGLHHLPPPHFKKIRPRR
jgi:hypothetical protein